MFPSLTQIISSTVLSIWYASTDLRIYNVNYELDRTRFTRLLKCNSEVIKYNLVVKDIIGRITLEVFITECVKIIKKYFESKNLKYKTRYSKINGDEYRIVDRYG